MNVPKISQKTKIWLLSSVGVILGMVLANAIYSLFDDAPQPAAAAVEFEPVSVAPPVPSVAEIVGRHLEWADQQTGAGVDPQLVPIHEFFAEARLGTRAFAEEVLGWESKWKLISDYLADGDEHKQFLEQRFAARIFAAEDLEKTLQFVIESYLHHVDNVDSMLLVNLQADLEGIPSSGFSVDVDRSVIEQSLQSAIHDAIAAVEAEFPGMIGRELVSYVAGEVLTMASVRLATSAGILSAGASSGAVTVGAGLVVGVIADAIVTWAYDELFDPAGELSRQLDGTLYRLEELIVEGDENEPGLHLRLLDYAVRRCQARNAAISAVVLQ